MIVVIKTYNGSREICFGARLVPDDMGTFDDLRQQVFNANNTETIMTGSSKEVQFALTSVSLDGSVLGQKASEMCDGVLILWLQKQKGKS